MSQKKVPDQTWETYAEEQIREAIEAGEFDNLSGFGKPIPSIDEPYDEEWWIREKLKREKISQLPPSLEIKRDVEKTLASIGALRSEVEVRREIQFLNERIRDAHYRSVWGPPSTQMPLDEEQIVTQWKLGRG